MKIETMIMTAEDLEHDDLLENGLVTDELAEAFVGSRADGYCKTSGTLTAMLEIVAARATGVADSSIVSSGVPDSDMVSVVRGGTNTVNPMAISVSCAVELAAAWPNAHVPAVSTVVVSETARALDLPIGLAVSVLSERGTNRDLALLTPVAESVSVEAATWT